MRVEYMPDEPVMTRIEQAMEDAYLEGRVIKCIYLNRREAGLFQREMGKSIPIEDVWVHHGSFGRVEIMVEQ
jgi:hypothetical protein